MVPRLVLDGEAFDHTLIWGFLFWTQIHISRVKVIFACLLTIGAVPDWANELSGPAFFWPFWCSLLSGIGRWRPGRHHEQQRPVSCIPVANFLNFTKKCQKKREKKSKQNRKNRRNCPWALLEPIQCPPKASGGSWRHKKGSPGTIWCLDPTVHSIYLT